MTSIIEGNSFQLDKEERTMKSEKIKNSQSNLAIYCTEIERLNWKIGGN